MSSSSTATRTRRSSSARPPTPRAAPASLRRNVPESFARRHRRGLALLAGCCAAVLIFLAGMGTASALMMDRMSGMKDKVSELALGAAGGGGGMPGGGGAGMPEGGGAGGATGTDLQKWAEEQGLPPGLSEQQLTMLNQKFPDGIPPETLEMIKQQLGG
ncbi:hypothetical protein [Streptomyces sp. NPDC050704]|uniref:hypothetical protein n=1 Tax=Streptomyces sp. NPDC050704 TaxID=3157219 RepID=UPI00343E6777